MAHPRLFLASLVVVMALASSSASAAACPPKQIFSGTLAPGDTETVSFTLPVKSQWTVVQFTPALCEPTADYRYTLSVMGGSMTSDCSVAVWLGRVASPGSHGAYIAGQFMGMEDMATMSYTLTVTQVNC